MASTRGSGRPPAGACGRRTGTRAGSARRELIARRRTATSRAWHPRAARGDRYGFRLDDDAKILSRPRVALRSPTARTACRRSSIPARSPGPTRDWRGVAVHGPGDLRAARRDVHGRGDLRGRGARAAAAARLGITVVELMPRRRVRRARSAGATTASISGRRRELYGTPDDLRRFVDRAHALGLGVILDVVYNHLGPDGNYLKAFAPDYFTDRHGNEWGEALNFDGAGLGAGARVLHRATPAYWIDEFHFDGLRLDATQAIHDESPEHVLAAIGRRVREAAGGRATLIVAEHEAQEARLVRAGEERRLRPRRRCGTTTSTTPRRVALTGTQRGLLPGLPRAAPGADLGAALGLPLPGPVVPVAAEAARDAGASICAAERFVIYLENHDQVANTLRRRAARDADVAGPAARDDGALVARAGNADAVPGAGVRRRPGRSSTSPTTTASWRASVRQGRGKFLEPVPVARRRRTPRQRWLRPGARETFARCKLDRARGAPAGAWPCTAICSRCAAAIRPSRSSAPIACDGAVLGERRWRCASAATNAAGPAIGCCS